MNEQAASNNRMVLLLIAGIPVTMILAATWLWYFVARGDLDLVGVLGTANSGTLLQPPLQLADYPVRTAAGNEFDLAELEPRWTFLIPVSGACDTDCEQKLYLTRQIHVAMGKEYNRIRRFYINDRAIADTPLRVKQLSDGRAAPQSLRKLLSTDHRDVLPLTLDGDAFRELFGGSERATGRWYLVDPAGWLMMSYDEQVHFKDVMSDLKFLLKNSSG